MATESVINGKRISLEVGLVEGDRGMFRAGDNAILRSGMEQRPLVTVQKNFYDPDLIPWYEGQNNEPQYLMRLIGDNPTLLGLILTKCTILHGEGLTLMRYVDGELQAVPENELPDEIADFLEYNDLDRLTYELLQDHEMTGNCFAQLRFTRGSSRVSKVVAEVNRVSPECVRAVKPKDNRAPIQRYAVAPTWENYEPETLKYIDAFRKRNFFDAERRFQPNSGTQAELLYHARRHMPVYSAYSPPHWYGARYHIELQNTIPRWHITNILNQFGARVRVSVSQDYLQDMMGKTNPSTQKYYTEVEVKDKVSKMVRDYLTNPENVGKVMLTRHIWDHQGKPLHDILVDTIKLDLKDDAYAAMEDVINNKITSSVGVQAALASLITNKGMSSGSELTQAWNIEAAKARRTQKLVLDLVKFIHRYNGWPAEYSWGFPNPSLVTKDLAASGMLPAAPTPPQPTDPQPTE